MKSKTTAPLPEFVLCRLNTSTGVERFVPDLIRRRAYELFEARGRQTGHDVEDWLQAEREVKHHLGIESSLLAWK